MVKLKSMAKITEQQLEQLRKTQQEKIQIQNKSEEDLGSLNAKKKTLETEMNALEKKYHKAFALQNQIEETKKSLLMNIDELDRITAAQLEEISNYRTPSEKVKKFMEAVFYMMEKKKWSWDIIRKKMAGLDFVDSVINFDYGSITSEQLKVIAKDYSGPQFSSAEMWKASKALGPIGGWFQDQVVLATQNEKLKPFEDQIKQFEEEKAEINKEKDEVSAKEKELRSQIQEANKGVKDIQSIFDRLSKSQEPDEELVNFYLPNRKQPIEENHQKEMVSDSTEVATTEINRHAVSETPLPINKASPEDRPSPKVVLPFGLDRSLKLPIAPGMLRSEKTIGPTVNYFLQFFKKRVNSVTSFDPLKSILKNRSQAELKRSSISSIPESELVNIISAQKLHSPLSSKQTQQVSRPTSQGPNSRASECQLVPFDLLTQNEASNGNLSCIYPRLSTKLQNDFAQTSDYRIVEFRGEDTLSRPSEKQSPANQEVFCHEDYLMVRESPLLLKKQAGSSNGNLSSRKVVTNPFVTEENSSAGLLSIGASPARPLGFASSFAQTQAQTQSLTQIQLIMQEQFRAEIKSRGKEFIDPTEISKLPKVAAFLAKFGLAIVGVRGEGKDVHLWLCDQQSKVHTMLLSKIFYYQF